MKLAASLICRDELGRHLEACVAHLLEFCDEIRVLDDASTDGSYEWLRAQGQRVVVTREPPARNGEDAFFQHAAARNRLLRFTLEGAPSHVLAVDADEFVADGGGLRAACSERGVDAWRLCLEEVWEAYPDRLEVRQDGGWNEHDVPILWSPGRVRALTIPDRGHATGRVPPAVNGGRLGYAGTSLLHFGWANHAERAERYERYAVGDAGRFHAKRHIESIMWPRERVQLESREWPEALGEYRERILERTGLVTV